jgi:hypothetical protein
MHFQVGVLVVWIIWSDPVLRSLVLVAFVELLSFALLPPIVAGIITAAGVVWMSVAARDELRTRRQWREDDEMIRGLRCDGRGCILIRDAGGEVSGAWTCPRCGTSDVDTLRLEDTGDDDQDPNGEVVVCERCGLRYRLP